MMTERANEQRTICFEPTSAEKVDFSSRSRPPRPLAGHNSSASQCSLRAARGSFGSGMFLLDETEDHPGVRKSSSKTDFAEWNVLTDVAYASPTEDENAASDERESEGIHFLRSRLQSTTQMLLKVSVMVLLIGSLTSRSYQRGDSAASGQASKSSISLGSAAISSVTETLSPILPFAGGVDLRREDHWSSGTWWESIQRVLVKAKDAFSKEEGVHDSTPDSQIVQLTQEQIKALKTTRRVASISAPIPFVSLDDIGALTLGEMSETFRYAMESSRKGFSAVKFYNSVSPRVKTVVQSMQSAVEKSRGKGVEDSAVASSSTTEHTFGEVDALRFAAAMRIFAEWRVIRAVPEGYKGYAVGMALGQKDIVQNLVKIEQAVHHYLDYQEGLQSLNAGISSRYSEIRVPTLYDLVRHEADLNIHPALPRLKDKTAAMGLLWVRRQLDYQTHVFDNVLQVPSRYETCQDAVVAAYDLIYDRYHGWAVQKIFHYSFQAAPNVDKIFRHMNPYRFASVREEVFNAMDLAEDRSTTVDADSARTTSQKKAKNPIVGILDHVGGEFDKLARNVGGEWDKFARFVVNVSSPDNKSQQRSAKRTGLVTDASFTEEMEDMVTKYMIQDAETQIKDYLSVVNPLLEDLRVLFDELNMDDPTRV